ncbi:hypothetical protein [Bacillus sp. FJAT-29937]|uniref:hypothetical protein n=1 Tax=Bacillus sp. FJAT-29937 TaxID=1720553 RepID=UPI0008327CC1|nr:hypothetical protein [Bacillus sp. FJAT-29937]
MIKELIDSLKGIGSFVAAFLFLGLTILLVSSPFLIIGYIFGDNKPNEYDPADFNQDGIVTSEEDEYYHSDLSELYNGK